MDFIYYLFAVIGLWVILSLLFNAGKKIGSKEDKEE